LTELSGLSNKDSISATFKMPEGRLFTTVEYVVLESLTKLILLWIRLDLPTLSLFALTVVTRRNVRKNSTAAALLKISL
jgi:hypothetical protein